MMMGWGTIGGCPIVRSIYIRLGVDAFPIQKCSFLRRPKNGGEHGGLLSFWTGLSLSYFNPLRTNEKKSFASIGCPGRPFATDFCISFFISSFSYFLAMSKSMTIAVVLL
jgi:hypothetical protein